MPTAITPLANMTATGTSTYTVTFSSISGAYRDLYLVISGAESATYENTWIRFNGDSGSNYNSVSMSGDGSTAASSSLSSQDRLTAAKIATTQGNIIHHIMDYSATDKHKTTLSRSNIAGNVTAAYAGRWANTSAITSIFLYSGSGYWVAGTTFALYGVSA